MKLAYYPPKQCVFIFHFIFCFHGGKFLGSPKDRLFHCYMRFLWAIWLHSRWPNPLEFPSSERLSTSVTSAVLWNSLSKASYLWISQQDWGKHSDSWFANETVKSREVKWVSIYWVKIKICVNISYFPYFVGGLERRNIFCPIDYMLYLLQIMIINKLSNCILLTFAFTV